MYNSSPLLFHEQQLQELQYTPATEAVQAYQCFAQEAHAEWSKFQSEVDDVGIYVQ
jgi:hypothetical protein